MEFRSGTGYSNPYKHQLSCLTNGNESKLLELYYDELRGQRSVYWPGSPIVNEKEKALNAYIRLIVLRSEPLSIVEGPEYKTFSMFSEPLSRKYVSEIILKLVEIVERKIDKKCQNPRGK